MATTSLNVIRTLTTRAKTEGVQETTRQLEGMAGAQLKVVDASAKQEKATLSVDAALQRLQRRYDQEFRAQQDLAKVARDLDRARAQGLLTQDRQAQLMRLAIKAHNDNSSAGKAHAKVLEELNLKAVALSGSLGTVGSVLTRFGPGGIAAAGALGGLAVAFGGAAAAALKLADTAGKLKDLSDVTGFTVVQLQALQTAGEQVGVSSESVTTALERFAVQFDELKNATGGLYTTLRQIDPALADQASRAGSLADAWDIVAKAVNKAEISERAALSRQAFGRSGVGVSRLLSASQDAGGLKGLEDQLNKLDRITAEQADKWDTLGDNIAKNTRLATQNVVATFGGPVLESLERTTAQMLELSRILRGTDWSAGWAGMFSTAFTWAMKVLPVFNAIGGAINLIKGATGSSTTVEPPREMAGPSRFDMEFGDLDQVQASADRMKALMEATKAYKDEVIRAANRSKDLMNALGGTATPAERLKDQVLQLNAAVAKNELTADQATKAIGRLQRSFAVQRQQDTVAALGDAATAAEKYEAKVASLKEKVDDGTLSQENYNRAVRALDPTFTAVRDAVADVGSALAQAFIQGQDAAEAFNNTLRSVAATAASRAITQALSGDFASASTSAVIAGAAWAASKLMGGESEAEKSAREASVRAEQTGVENIARFNQAAALARLGNRASSTQEGALAAFDINAQAERSSLIAQFRDGKTSTASANAQVAALEAKLAAERLNIIEDFAQRAVDIEKQAAERRRSFLARELSATTDTSTLAGQLLLFETQANEERLQEQENGGQAMAELERALAAERLKIEKDFAAKEAAEAEAAREALANRMKAIDDRLFNALNDANTLEGALAAFDRQAQRDREAEAKAGGEGLVELEQAIAVERFSIIQKFNDDAIAEEKRAAEERQNAINAAAKNIILYINGLLAGPSSSLTPKGRLSAAQAAYNAQLALAQSGNIDAQAGITQFADDLLKAAKDVFASTGGYASLQAQIIQQLNNLPAVQQSTDPIVQALSDLADDTVNALQAIGTSVSNVNTSVSGVGTAVGNVNTSVSGVGTAVGNVNTSVSNVNTSVSGVGTAVGNVNTAVTNVGTAVGNVSTSVTNVGTAVDGVGTALGPTGTLGDVKTNTANTHTDLSDPAVGTNSLLKKMSDIFDNLVGSTAFVMQTPAGSGPPNTGVNSNNVMHALNKIVLNTWATSINTSMLAGIGSRYGQLAAGGWITGGIPFRDSVMLANGGSIGMPGEFVLNREVSQRYAAELMQLNASGRWPANDNQMLGMIYQCLEMLRQENRMGHTQTARETRRAGDNSSEAIYVQTKDLDRSQRRTADRDEIRRKRA